MQSHSVFLTSPSLPPFQNTVFFPACSFRFLIIFCEFYASIACGGSSLLGSHILARFPFASSPWLCFFPLLSPFFLFFHAFVFSLETPPCRPNLHTHQVIHPHSHHGLGREVLERRLQGCRAVACRCLVDLPRHDSSRRCHYPSYA